MITLYLFIGQFPKPHFFICNKIQKNCLPNLFIKLHVNQFKTCRNLNVKFKNFLMHPSLRSYTWLGAYTTRIRPPAPPRAKIPMCARPKYGHCIVQCASCAFVDGTYCFIRRLVRVNHASLYKQIRVNKLFIELIHCQNYTFL